MGVEVNTARVWDAREELELSRVVFVNMLDRERADFYRVLALVAGAAVGALRGDPAADRLRARADAASSTCCTTARTSTRRALARATRSPIPEELAATVEEYRTKLLDAVVETDEALMERYLGGEEIPTEDIAAALKNAVTRDEIYPVSCGVATKNLGTHALLDLIVEGVPSPAKKGSPIETDATVAAFVFKTVADPFAGRISCFRVYAGEVKRRHDARQPPRPLEGAPRLADGDAGQGSRRRRTASAPGDIGAVAKLKDVQTGDVLVDAEHDLEPPVARLPRAGDELRGHREDERRRGQGRAGAAPARRRGSDASPAPRPRRPGRSCSPA